MQVFRVLSHPFLLLVSPCRGNLFSFGCLCLGTFSLKVSPVRPLYKKGLKNSCRNCHSLKCEVKLLSCTIAVDRIWGHWCEASHGYFNKFSWSFLWKVLGKFKVIAFVNKFFFFTYAIRFCLSSENLLVSSTMLFIVIFLIYTFAVHFYQRLFLVLL